MDTWHLNKTVKVVQKFKCASLKFRLKQIFFVSLCKIVLKTLGNNDSDEVFRDF